MIDQFVAPFVPRVVATWPDPALRWRRVGGALLFVDISGFTAMSERLAVLGREGAERVTEIIDTAFAALLAEAYSRGAGLLKFGGDALLLLFEGEDAVNRAARSAMDMRARLRDVGHIPTPAGTVTLKMSCGVHAGDIDLFLAGDRHLELLVTGPHATAVVDAEGSAGAGNIVVSPAAAALLPARCIGDAADGGFLLHAAPDVPPTTEALANPESDELWQFIPLALRTHLAHATREVAEHRRTTVAFIHFDHTDALVAADPRDALAAFDEVCRVVQAAADEFEICVLSSDIDHDGGKLILTAGAPLVHEDDDDRMLLAVRQILDARTRVPLRIGVHGGALLAAEVGPFYRRFYTVMGDVVNTAARVMSRAEPREALVTTETMARVAVPFSTEPIEPFAVKGKAEPLEAVRLGDRLVQSEDDGADGDTTTIVGREAELALLEDRWQASRLGHGATLEFVGPAGIGKTELMRENLRRHGADHVIVLRCHRITETTPYGAIQAALRTPLGLSVNATADTVGATLEQVLADNGDRVPERVAVLSSVLGTSDLTGGNQATFRSLLTSTIDLLLQLGYPDGVRFVVENAQWIDEPSLALLRSLSELSPTRPWLIVSTRRDERDGRGSLGGEVVDVDELSPEDATLLAVATSGGTLLPTAAQAVIARTGGNPLFIKEFVGLLGDAGAVDLDEMPASLESIFAAKVDRLDPTDRSIVRTLAVLGIEFEIVDAATLLGITEDDVDELVTRLGDVLVRTGDRVRFGDALLQDTAYGGLPFRRRRALHLEAGLALEQRLADPRTRADALATHFNQALDHERTWRYAVEAGSRSMARHGYAEAATRFEHALAAVQHLDIDADTEAAVWQDLGMARRFEGRVAAAVEPFSRARRLFTQTMDRADQCLRDGDIHRKLGQHLTAVRWYRKGIRLLDDDERGTDKHAADRLRSRLLTGEATVRIDQGRRDEAVTLLERSLSIAEVAEDHVAVAHACVWLLEALYRTDIAAAVRHGERALAIYSRQGDDAAGEIASARNALGNAADEAGDWATAAEHFAAASAALTAMDRPTDAAIAAFNGGQIDLRRGRIAEAEKVLTESTRILGVVGHAYEPIVSAVLACAQDAGAPDIAARLEAEVRFESGLNLVRNYGLDAMLPDLHLEWAKAAAWRGDIGATEERLSEIPTPMGPDVTAHVARLSAAVAIARGDLRGAHALHEWAMELAEAFGDGYHLGLAHAVGAELAVLEGCDPGHHRAEADRILGRLGVVAAPGWAAPTPVGAGN